MTAPTDTDDMNELIDANIARVDLVGKAANGTSFLIAKARSEGRGLFEADLVRDLIAKSDAQEGSTMTAPTDVAKADEDIVEPDAADLTQVLAEPAGSSAPGSDTDPGSPAWEQVDAATACKWTAIAVRLKNAIETLASREGVESASDNGSGDDMDNQWNLEDAASAVDYAISVLAPYAVGEQAEADLGSEELDSIGKSMAGLDLNSLEVLEALAPILKAGRAISSASETKLQTAYDSIGEVLSTIKQAPVADDLTKSKETDMTASTDTAGVDSAMLAAAQVKASLVKSMSMAEAVQFVTVTEGATISKAKGDPQMAVFTADGALVGTIDPEDLSPIAAPTPPDGGDAAGADDTTATAPADDLDPAAPDATGTPADAPAPAPTPPAAAPDAPVAPTVPDDDTTVTKAQEDLLKSLVEDRIKAALDEERAAHAAVVKALDDRLTAWENKPAQSGVLTNGALPPAHLMRGQGIVAPDISRGAELRKALAEETDAVKQKQIADEMQGLAVEAIRAAHSAGR